MNILSQIWFSRILKRPLSLMLAVMLLGSLTACSKPPEATQKQAEPSQQKPTETKPAAQPEPAKSNEPLTKVKIAQSIDDLSYLPIYVARAKKFFEAEGVDPDVSVIQGGGGPEMAALITGEVQFAASNPARLITMLKQNRPLIGVQNILGKSIVQVVMANDVAQRLNITSSTPLDAKLKAWKGLKIGVSRPGSLTHQFAQFLLKKAGLKETDVEIIGVGSGGAAVAAVTEKKIDVLVMSSPTPEELVVSRKAAQLIVDNASGEVPEFKEYLQQLLVVNKEWAEKNKELVKKVVRALNKANAFIVDNPPEASVDLIKQYYPTLNQEVLLAAVKTIRKGIAKDGSFTEAGVMANFLLDADGENLRKTMKWTDLVTNEYLK